MKKQKKTLVEQILDKAGLDYSPVFLNISEGRAKLPEGLSPVDIYKTLALAGDKTGPILGILPLSEHLSEKKLAKISGNKKVQMIPQKDLQRTTGYVHGANNPVGIHQTKKFPIYLDTLAENKAFIVVSSGEIGRSIKINPHLLADFVQAQFADFKA